MNGTRLAELKEKYKNRNLLEELAWGVYTDHSGYTSKSDGEFLNWLCFMAYKTIKSNPQNTFDELCKCDLFTGIYDAKNGDEHFMNGIETVMECIAYMVSEECGDNFQKEFIQNMIESQEKAKEINNAY